MQFGQLCVVLLLNCGTSVMYGNNWTFLSQLQDLCPYSSFCEENATMSLPEQDNIRPCCDSCSCKPGCELDNNCCHDFVGSNKTELLRQCTSPIVSNMKRTTTNYSMIYSCPISSFETGYRDSTLCTFDNNDYKSFAPVVSQKTGELYVNSECAVCNNVNDTISWKLSVKCPMDTEDHGYDTQRLLQDSNVASAGCYLSYDPPKHINLETRECRNDVIRTCNVSGGANVWEPLWEYCPMFNATFSRYSKTVYGNVFCYMCNENYMDRMAKLCGDGGIKTPNGVPFTSVLDLEIVESDKPKTPDHIHGVCHPTEMLVNGFETECRRVECSSGQFRIGDRCGFYSKEWIGGPFTAVLKLSPLDRTQKIDRSMLSDLSPELKYNKKARWLKRNAMKHWYIETLYKPSDDKKDIEYLVALARYPRRSVNPSRLTDILKQTLKETWLLQINDSTIPLRVQLNIYHRYHKMHKDNLAKSGEYIEEEYAYVERSSGKLFYAVYNTIDYNWSHNMFLGELFLCDQIQLHPNEYKRLPGTRSRLWFKVTNNILSVTQYRILEGGSVLICLQRFPRNNGLRVVHQVGRVLFVACSCVWFTWVKLCQ